MGRRRQYVNDGEDTSWMAKARCRGLDPGLFYPEGGGILAQVAEAKAVCATCPVANECLSFSFLVPWGMHGIWGGTTEEERRNMRQKVG